MSKDNVDLPCLITPDVLHFSAKKSERGSPQVITIFNHYDFAIYYKILSTSPQLYTIGSTQGIIKPASSMEIVIDLKEDAARLLQENAHDKFKVEVADINSTATHKKIIKTTTIARGNVSVPPSLQLSDLVDIDRLRKLSSLVVKSAPIFIGIMALLVITPTDDILITIKFWLAFFIGLACMYFYNKLAQA